MLEYDNSAFYYFALTLLSFYLIPGVWFTLKEVLISCKILSDGSAVQARTSCEFEKTNKIKKNNTGTSRLKKWPFILNLIILIPSLICFTFLVQMVKNNGEVSRFDPYTILGIEAGASTADIKKAYRKMSLKYHPDKNIGDKVAEDTFMKVAKAYEALTDETSKDNYEKFGNPDGKQSLEVSIGLPKIILDNPKVVLVLYLLMIVVVIPLAVGVWYAYSKQYGEKNIKYESYAAFYQLLTEAHRIKNMPEVMAASAECRKINSFKEEDKLAFGKLYGKMKNDRLMVKPKYDKPEYAMILKGNILLHAHVLRLQNELTPSFQENLDDMLNCSLDLIEGLIEMSYQRRWVQTTISSIKFSQCLIQALWVNDSPFLQLPHFTETDANIVSKGNKAPSSFTSFIRNPLNDKNLLKNFSDEKIKDITNACQVIPHIKVTVKLFVEEEEKEDFYLEEEETSESSPAKPKKQFVTYNPNISKNGTVISGDSIYENDLVTLKVKLTRENVTEKGKAALVHAPLFPKAVIESWWLILTDSDAQKNATTEPTIHAVERLTDQSRDISHDIRFMAPPKAGDYVMDLNILSENYIGLDEKLEIKFTVLPADELPDYVPHPEDVELDNEPTLFEQVMTANIDESSDEEDDDGEEAADEREVPLDDD